MWWDEHLEAIRRSDRPVAVVAEPEWGAGYLIANIEGRGRPTIKLVFEPGDREDQVAQGNRLSDSLATAFSAPLFGYGLPYKYGLDLLERHAELLAPFDIIVIGAEHAQGFCQELVRMSAEDVAVVLWYRELEPSLPDGCFVISSEDLAATKDEMRLLVPDSVPTEIVERAFEISAGAVGSFLQEVNNELGLPSPDIQWGEGSGLETEPNVLLHLAQKEGDWLKVLELTAVHSPANVLPIIQIAGDYAFERGQFRRLWDALELLPESLAQNPEVLYWSLSAAIALNRHKPRLAFYRQQLCANEAPELRALMAMAFLGEESLDEARRAAKYKRSAVTLKALGFLTALFCPTEDAIPILFEAYSLARKEQKMYLAVSAAESISWTFASRGDYQQAIGWSRWALDQFAKSELREEIRRLCIASQFAYNLLVTGQLETAKSEMEGILVSEDLIGVPSLESVVSTIADIAYIEKDYETAVELYKKNYLAYRDVMAGHLSADLVTALVTDGRQEEAVESANECFRRAKTLSNLEAAKATIAMGIANYNSNSAQALQYFKDSESYLSNGSDAGFLARATIWLCKCHLRDGDVLEARRLLKKNRFALEELGDSGWSLLGGVDAMTQEVRELFTGQRSLPRVLALGQRVLARGQEREPLTLRASELLALLLAHPDGLSSERLNLEMYGVDGNPVTLKATLSKLRRRFAIGSRPYRLEEPLEADFVDLSDALEAGDVDRALELYRGPLLPGSDAPGVVALRQHLEESLRQAVLASREADAVLRLAYLLEGDLELWESALELLPPSSTQIPLVRAHIRRIHREWGAQA